jgi:hypothetical protein
VQGINKASVVSGNGYQVRRYSNSTVIQPSSYTVGGGLLKNFRVTSFVDENDIGRVTVSVGTVNRTIPKIQGRYIDDTDENGLPLMITVPNEGYIVVECLYSANSPFPKNSEIKLVGNLESLDNNNISQYPLAKVKYVSATFSGETRTSARVDVNQIHIEGNLSVSRVKVGADTVYWQWWTV